MKTEINSKMKKITLCLVCMILYLANLPLANAQVKNAPGNRSSNISYLPLEHFWNSSRKDNLSTANNKVKNSALAKNYRLVRTDGYILAEASNVEGHAAPLYLYYSDARQDYFATSTREGIRTAVASGYRKVCTEGYILKTVSPNYQKLYQPLWLYYHPTRMDNFTTATAAGARAAEEAGYRKVRIEGYIRIQKPGNFGPLDSAPMDELFDDSRNNFLITNLPRSSQSEIDHWNKVVNKMQGIDGVDPLNNFINTPPAEKTESNIVLEKLNNWIPVDNTKHACCGNLHGFQTYDGAGDEMDWNLFIAPNDEFLFLINNVLKYKDPKWGKTPIIGGYWPSDWHPNEFGGYLLEGELTPDETLYDNLFFPNSGKEENSSGDITRTPNLGFVQRKEEICIYGPWVREVVHNNRPEIHPCEMIWWRVGDGYYMMLLQDDSNRFDDKDDFDLDNFAGLSRWKPWAAPPLTAQFKIAFAVNPSDTGLPLTMDIREVYNRFVVTNEDGDASADSDNGTSHALVLNNKKLLVVNEQQPNDNDLGVKFVDISKRPDGTIQGYLQITTKVGGPDLAGDEGYHILYVQKK